jgi:hypothetical protein
VGFLEDRPGKAKLVSYEEEHVCTDDCHMHDHGHAVYIDD